MYGANNLVVDTPKKKKIYAMLLFLGFGSRREYHENDSYFVLFSEQATNVPVVVTMLT